MLQTVLACLIVAALLGLAGIFAWRQFQALKWLRAQQQMSPEDRVYFRRQFVRRIVGCVLMAVLAILIVGFFILDVSGNLDRMLAEGEVRGQGNEPPPLKPGEHDFLGFGLGYVAVTVLVLFLLLGIAFADLMAIRRYGTRHRKRIRADEQAMLLRQLPSLQHDRNGERGSELK